MEMKIYLCHDSIQLLISEVLVYFPQDDLKQCPVSLFLNCQVTMIVNNFTQVHKPCHVFAMKFVFVFVFGGQRFLGLFFVPQGVFSQCLCSVIIIFLVRSYLLITMKWVQVWSAKKYRSMFMISMAVMMMMYLLISPEMCLLWWTPARLHQIACNQKYSSTTDCWICKNVHPLNSNWTPILWIWIP